MPKIEIAKTITINKRLNPSEAKDVLGEIMKDALIEAEDKIEEFIQEQLAERGIDVDVKELRKSEPPIIIFEYDDKDLNVFYNSGHDKLLIRKFKFNSKLEEVK